MFGTTEALIIGGIIVLLFGAKKLPELAKSMGQSKAAFDEGVAEGAPAAEASGENKGEGPLVEGGIGGICEKLQINTSVHSISMKLVITQKFGLQCNNLRKFYQNLLHCSLFLLIYDIILYGDPGE